MVEHARRAASKADFPLAAFLAQPRQWEGPPTPGALRAELEAQLTPASVYRVVWRLPAPPQEEPEGFSWATVPCPLPQ
jgi:hypothetical protein